MSLVHDAEYYARTVHISSNREIAQCALGAPLPSTERTSQNEIMSLESQRKILQKFAEAFE